jgi:hypothetical protein
MARGGRQVHSEEPLGQVRTRLVKDDPGSRVNVVATFLAGTRRLAIG